MSTEQDTKTIAEQSLSTDSEIQRFMGFKLGDEDYALEILKVHEIIGLMEVTPVPKTPDYVRGVINLRGKVIPVIDLRLKFEMPAVENTELTCIMVIQVSYNDQEVTMSIVVDAVSEVIDLANAQIEKTPEMGSDTRIDFLLGIGKLEQQVIMLLDADQILSRSDFAALDEVTKN